MAVRTPYIQPFRDVTGRWRFRIRAANHRGLAYSRAYSSWGKCWKTVGMLHGATGLPIDVVHVERTGILRKRKIKHLMITKRRVQDMGQSGAIRVSCSGIDNEVTKAQP